MHVIHIELKVAVSCRQNGYLGIGLYLKVRLWWFGAVLRYPCKHGVSPSLFNIPKRVIYH